MTKYIWDREGKKYRVEPDRDTLIGPELYAHIGSSGIMFYQGRYDPYYVSPSELSGILRKDILSEEFAEAQKNGEARGIEEWEKLKAKLEKEYYFCPFCPFPATLRDAAWQVISSRERLREHIAERHLSVKADVNIVNKTYANEVEYRHIHFEEGF